MRYDCVIYRYASIDELLKGDASGGVNRPLPGPGEHTLRSGRTIQFELSANSSICLVKSIGYEIWTSVMAPSGPLTAASLGIT